MTARKLKWLAGVAAGAFACIGCGSASQSTPQPDGGVAEAPAICDGSAGARLRIFVEPQNARELRGSIVRVENGYPSLMIDGSCGYWIGGGWIEDPMTRDLGWRQGHLDAALEQELRMLVNLGNLSSLQDCMTNTVTDASTRSLRAATSRARCIQGGPHFEAAWSWATRNAPDLWRQGVPLNGGIRVEAIPLHAGDDSNAYVWPSGMPLAALILPDNEGSNQSSSGVSTLITDTERAQALRALRDQYIADRTASPGLFFDGQKMTDEDNTSATVFMRDQLPYEDNTGLLPFSDAPASAAP